MPFACEPQRKMIRFLQTNSARARVASFPMNDNSTLSIRPQPLIAVADVEHASLWYQRILGADSDHGGPDYERLVVDGRLVLQLHKITTAHHHGTIGDPSLPVGNGVALWFETTTFDAVVGRIREFGAHVETDVHINPNANQREIWLRDTDRYLVVFAEAVAR